MSRLHRDQLQKFAQYLISELPQQILPTAQRLLDELLSSQQTAINTVCGAPDPTAGASAQEQTTWCLDESQLHENIRKILIKLCVPSPIVFSDVNYLSSTAPPAATEWTSLLRPLRGREPEGMWNLLSIVREMLRRNDRNAIPLLEILTEEVLACDQIILWWFNTKVSLHAGINGHGNRGSIHSNTHASQHACSSLCDEIVVLWRLAALNPALSPLDSKAFFMQLHDWHLKTLERVLKMRSTNSGNNATNGIKKSDIDVFPGFKPAMEGCLMDWSDYPIPGITYNSSASLRWYTPSVHAHTASTTSTSHNAGIESSSSANPSKYSLSRRGRSVEIGQNSQITPSSSHPSNERKLVTTPISFPIRNDNSQTLPVIHSTNRPDGVHSKLGNKLVDSNRSSLSSEGFCETENEPEFEESLSAATSSLSKVTIFQEQAECSSRITRESSSTDCTEIVRDLGDAGDNANGNSASESSPGQSTAASLPSSSDVEPSIANSSKAYPNKNRLRDDDGSHPADEFDLYYFDTKASAEAPLLNDLNKPSNNSNIRRNDSNCDPNTVDEGRIVVNVRKIEETMEILFARAEALHAHGRTLEACRLAVKLAEELLAHPPNLMVELPNPPARGKRGRRFNPACHQISLLASATLSKTAFLCSVLGENTEYHYLAFRVGLFGLEMARPPASTKALEVKLANQEQDLVSLLKRIPLTPSKLQMLREKAEQLRDGTLRSRGEALLPLMLASYIFDALVLSTNQPTRSSSSVISVTGKLPLEEKLAFEKLGFEAAVAALGLKANVSEAEHPLLCEGTRRQRGELAITLLVNYKDDQEKLAKIMDKLLDKEVHQMYKTSVIDSFNNINNHTYTTDSTNCSPPRINGNSQNGIVKLPERQTPDSNSTTPSIVQPNERTVFQNSDTIDRRGSNGSDCNAKTQANRRKSDSERGDGATSPCWDEDYKAWEARFRCTNFRTNKKHSVGMASVDSSAPETTSSDNSPTVVRRTMWMRPGGPGSDSGSSGESSDSFASSSSGDKAARAKRDSESPQVPAVANRMPVANLAPEPVANAAPCNRLPNNVANLNSNGVPGCSSSSVALAANSCTPLSTTPLKQTRFKGKRAYPSIPNQPSEASAYFMFELAKTVLTKAGGNSTAAVLFTQPSATQNHRGPHRALHMCAFQIGVYALGLHNTVSPNWLSRTYSSHVSWITGQAMEIGSAAINFLIDTWEGHLTPPEIASLADRASRGREPGMVRAAAELALSCLPHAHALNPNEIQRALIQCKEQSSDMLERACLAVESAAKGGGVYPEVLFEVARKWFELYEESLQERSQRSVHRAQGSNRTNSNEVVAQSGSSDEFQSSMVPNVSGANAIGIIPDQQHHMMAQAQQDRHHQVESILGPQIPSNPGNGPTPTPLPLQVIPPLSCAPPGGAFALSHPNAPYPYGFYQGVPAYPQAAPIPFQYISAAPSSCPYPYPFYSANAVATTTALPHLRNCMPPVALFQNQPLMPNVTQGPQLSLSRPSLITITTAPMQQPHQALPHFSTTSLPNQHNQPLQQLNQRQLGYLLSAYRVGMLAMDTLARRVHDDRPQAKYARNPSYGEDVKWLLNVAKKLGKLSTVVVIQEFAKYIFFNFRYFIFARILHMYSEQRSKPFCFA